MRERVYLLNHDCLPPHENAVTVRGSAWWILTAVIAVGILWTILE